ncbi:hypothetical protein ACWEQG_28375 [Microbispora sp. NPDC004025]
MFAAWESGPAPFGAFAPVPFPSSFEAFAPSSGASPALSGAPPGVLSGVSAAPSEEWSWAGPDGPSGPPDESCGVPGAPAESPDE